MNATFWCLPDLWVPEWRYRGVEPGPGCSLCLQRQPVGGIRQHEELPD